MVQPLGLLQGFVGSKPISAEDRTGAAVSASSRQTNSRRPVISFAARSGSMAEVRQAIGKPGEHQEPQPQGGGLAHQSSSGNQPGEVGAPSSNLASHSTMAGRLRRNPL